MRILGINKGSTTSGKLLRDGGSAALIDDSLIAVSEARPTGIKYARGYSSSLDAILASRNLDVEQFDAIGVSTCCETLDDGLLGHELSGHPRLTAIGHHLSHAALAFYGSGFDRALVAVIDGGGNVLSAVPYDKSRWWTAEREQHSYYIGSRVGGLELIARDFAGPFSVGMAEMYRAFTHYLGWHSDKYASKTMALAGHGRRGQFSEEIFYFEGDHLASPLANDPHHPIPMVLELGRQLGLDFGEPRDPNAAILQIHRDLAAYLQSECERALLARLRALKTDHDIDYLCIAGGFALNVVVNGKLGQIFPSGVYIPPAPGDDGQSLGNVFVLHSRLAGPSSVNKMTHSSTALLGPQQSLRSADVAAALKRTGCERYVVFETTDPSDLVAEILAGGAPVCVFESRSEFGPRALGARSILADPRRQHSVAMLNSLKRREWFMPFAPAVLEDHLEGWFDASLRSPFMSKAVSATDRTLQEAPAIVNADGTARVQTIARDDEGALPKILQKFERLTGLPILLNTSFNLGGEPIVETIDQALSTFAKVPLNVLQVDRFIIAKVLSPDIVDLPIASSLDELRMEVFSSAQGSYSPVVGQSLLPIVRELQALTDAIVFVRTELPLYDEYLDWLREGRKVTTIRFRKGGVEIPFNSTLPLFETRDFSFGDRSRPVERVRVSALWYRRFGMLSTENAHRDGFRDVPHMRDALRTIYPELEDEDWVTVYEIHVVR